MSVSTSPLIVGVGATTFGNHAGTSSSSLACAAAAEALADAGADAAEVEAAYVGNAMAGLIWGQESVRGQVALAPLGLQGAPIYNVENACASSSSALALAMDAVGAGAVEVTLVVGVEKLRHHDRDRVMRAFEGAVDVERLDESAGRSGAPRMARERSL